MGEGGTALLEAGIEALLLLATVERMMFLVLGCMLGLLVGILPGLGGTVGMSILLPFIYGMDSASGIALLVGLIAVTSTSDTFPSVLMGIPGSAGSQATIMDGYPLAQKGQAARALGAGFTSSLIGGLIGAVSLLGLIAVARPLVLALGSPELLMLALLGLSTVGVLSSGVPLLGLAAGFLGLFIGSIGAAPAHPTLRFTMGFSYLNDGISLALVALGLFAVPEIIDLLANRRSVSSEGVSSAHGQFQGLKDTLKNMGLVVRSSLLGVGVGVLPGVGGSVVDWLSYSAARQTVRDNSQFGKGDIRGVIAPESSNNAKEGGSLIPTLLFGIPGSGSTAMLLGGLILLDIQVGPDMVGANLHITMSIVWTLAIANVIATTFCFGLIKQVSRIAIIPAQKLMPFLIVIIFVAAYQSSRRWGDIVTVLVIGVIGWTMKQVGWPRPALLIGFVLGVPAERYLRISMEIYGYEWMRRPGVIAIAALLAVFLVFGFRRAKKQQSDVDPERPFEPGSEEGSDLDRREHRD